MAIKFAAGADLRHLREFMAGRQPDEPQGALQVLDVVLREVASQRYLSVRRSFYSPGIRTPQRLGDGLQSWFGFYQSIRPTQMGLSLNIGEILLYALVVSSDCFPVCTELTPVCRFQTCRPRHLSSRCR